MEMCLGGVCNGANFMADLLPYSWHIVHYKESPFNRFAFLVAYLLFKRNTNLCLAVA